MLARHLLDSQVLHHQAALPSHAYCPIRRCRPLPGHEPARRLRKTKRHNLQHILPACLPNGKVIVICAGWGLAKMAQTHLNRLLSYQSTRSGTKAGIIHHATAPKTQIKHAIGARSAVLMPPGGARPSGFALISLFSLTSIYSRPGLCSYSRVSNADPCGAVFLPTPPINLASGRHAIKWPLHLFGRSKHVHSNI